jgi:hypothetical protein
MFEETGPMTGPVLMMAGGGGGSGNDDELFSSIKFWLWPLPVDGDTRLVAQWQDLGMQEESVSLAGDQLRMAAASVQKYWSSPASGERETSPPSV